MKIINILTVIFVNILILLGFFDSFLKYSEPEYRELKHRSVFAIMTIVFLIILIWFNFEVIR